jgi:hypothetical protein
LRIHGAYLDAEKRPVVPNFSEFPKPSDKRTYEESRKVSPERPEPLDVSWYDLYGNSRPSRYEACRALMLGQSRGLPTGWDIGAALLKHRNALTAEPTCIPTEEILKLAFEAG